MKEATTNNTSSNAIKSVKKDKEKTSGDEQKNVDAKVDAASKKIAQEKIEDKAAEDIHNEEVKDGKEKSDAELRSAAYAYIKNTIGNKDFYDSLTEDISNSLTSWLDTATKLDVRSMSSTIDSVTGNIDNVDNVLNNKQFNNIMSTASSVGKKLDAFEKSAFLGKILDGTASKDTSEKLHDLFKKAGIKGGDNVIDYISNKVIGTMSGEKFKNKVFTDKDSILHNLKNFTTYLDNIQKTIVEINNIVQEIKNQIYSVAENAIKTVINVVKSAISDIVNNVVSSAVGALKDSLSDAWKAGLSTEGAAAAT